MVSRVHKLFEQPRLRAEIVALLRKDPTLKEAEREFAIQLAQAHREANPETWDYAAYRVVRNPRRGKEAYALALRQADTAVRLAPGNGHIFSTLGVAEYRMGRYADSLTTLTKSEKLNATKEGSHPADLAFLAMVQHQLGKKDEAKATFARLRAVMKQPRWVQSAEVQDLLREAEETLKQKPASEKK